MLLAHNRMDKYPRYPTLYLHYVASQHKKNGLVKQTVYVIRRFRLIYFGDVKN